MEAREHLSVLLVEDNEAHYYLVQAQLASAKFATYELDWTADYDEALRLITQNNYDVCILDYDLGSHSGLEFLEEDGVRRSAVPIIVLTGQGDYRVDYEVMQRGAVDYIDKTHMHVDSLDRAIRYALHHTKAKKTELHQRIFLQTLISVINDANNAHDFNDVIKRMLNNIWRVIPYDTVDFMLVENDYARVTHCVVGHDEELETQIIGRRFQISETETFRRMQETQSPLLIPDTGDDGLDLPVQPARSYLGTPVISGRELIGFLNLTASEAGFFTEEHSERLWILAQQTAFAIQNTREYERARAYAIVEERNRLARDLHDSVSQTLFSSRVISESLSVLIDQDIDATKDGLTRLATLTNHALAEMRSLLIELRPSGILDETPDNLLHQLASSILAPANIDYSIISEGLSCPLPEDVHIAFYRIAGEALNNIMKHARARSVTIKFDCQSHGFSLRIHDDGQGFDRANVDSSRFGIRFMSERAEKAGIALEIDSQPDNGTVVNVGWTRSPE